MDTALDLSRWRAAPKGVGYRRWTIISAGLRQLGRTRLFKVLLALAWVAGLLIGLAGFVFSQAVSSGGWLERFGPRMEAIAAAITGLVALYPDVCINALFTSVFWLHSYIALTLSLVALTTMVPQLIARDQASNAITIYLSRPLTSVDYLLGKLGTIAGVLLILWTGPLLFGWVLSMLFATDSEFMMYSFGPLLRALWFNGIALVVLAVVALGVSALNRSSRITTLIWIGLWIFAGFIARIPETPVWLQRASFTHNLDQVRQSTLRLDEALNSASMQLPILDQRFAQSLKRGSEKTQAKDFNGALIGLGVLTALSSAVFFRRLRPD